MKKVIMQIDTGIYEKYMEDVVVDTESGKITLPKRIISLQDLDKILFLTKLEMYKS